MKKRTLTTICALGVLCAGLGAGDQTPTVETTAPVVVKTVPEAGSKNVASGVTEIKITFSKEMLDGSWTWATAWQNSTPEGNEKPRYEADHKTCVLKVNLEPGKTYGYWINSQRFGNFKDAQGRSAVPYLLVFETKR